MKKSTILDIFNGRKGRIDTIQTPKDFINKEIKLFCDTYDKLEKELSPELLDLLQKLVALSDDSHSKEIDFYFAEGFKLGLLIGIECMEN